MDFIRVIRVYSRIGVALNTNTDTKNPCTHEVFDIVPS